MLDTSASVSWFLFSLMYGKMRALLSKLLLSCVCSYNVILKKISCVQKCYDQELILRYVAVCVCTSVKINIDFLNVCRGKCIKYIYF